jgi:hypothetical protein
MNLALHMKSMCARPSSDASYVWIAAYTISNVRRVCEGTYAEYAQGLRRFKLNAGHR